MSHTHTQREWGRHSIRKRVSYYAFAGTVGRANGFGTATICHCVNDVCNSANNSRTRSRFPLPRERAHLLNVQISIAKRDIKWVKRPNWMCPLCAWACAYKMPVLSVFVWWFSLVAFWHTNTNIVSSGDESWFQPVENGHEFRFVTTSLARSFAQFAFNCILRVLVKHSIRGFKLLDEWKRYRYTCAKLRTQRRPATLQVE